MVPLTLSKSLYHTFFHILLRVVNLNMKSSHEAYASIVIENKTPCTNQSSDKNPNPSTGFDSYKKGKLNSININSFHHHT